jgi:hypothetical protein
MEMISEPQIVLPPISTLTSPELGRIKDPIIFAKVVLPER